MFRDQIILVTGGTGSFGNAIVEKFLKIGVKEIRIFSRDEKKQNDMRIKYCAPNLKFFIGDVRDYVSVDFAMKDVDYVFHAAALKQVPSCEFYPMEAVRTNILGVENVIRSAIKQKVKKLVCLSTDKAAYPINAMGISKAMMEKVAISNARVLGNGNTIICCTRYGNVMGSRGSIIPLVLDQIKTKHPITVTNPEMTRFMMTLDEAVDLVLFAFKSGEQGDLFVQKSPASTVGTLIAALMDIKQATNEFQIIGTRHGEKLYETLLTAEEASKAVDLGRYYKVPMDDRNLNYEKYYEKGQIENNGQIAYTSQNTERLDLEEMKKLLGKFGVL